MREERTRRFSRRDLFTGFMRRVRGQDLESQASGFDPEILEADALLREKNYQDASARYEAILENEPGHEEALRKLGYCQLKMNQTSLARQTWERLFKMKPGDHFAVLYTGLSHAMDDNAQEAVTVWKRYFNIKQPLIQREINLILALYERGDQPDPKQMVKSIEEAVVAQKNMKMPG